MLLCYSLCRDVRLRYSTILKLWISIMLVKAMVYLIKDAEDNKTMLLWGKKRVGAEAQSVIRET